MKKYASQKVLIPVAESRRHLDSPKKLSVEQRIKNQVLTRSESHDSLSSASDPRLENSIAVQMYDY